MNSLTDEQMPAKNTRPGVFLVQTAYKEGKNASTYFLFNHIKKNGKEYVNNSVYGEKSLELYLSTGMQRSGR